jgi:hypothetical protein
MAIIFPKPPVGPSVKAPAYRAPSRQSARPEVRGRNGEILTRQNRSNTLPDQFDLPTRMLEKGWSYQWNRTSCYGLPDPNNINSMMENGWRPVMADRFPGRFHPVDYKGAIEREGLMLMERPDTMTQEAIEDGIIAARRQRHNQQTSFTGQDKIREVLSEGGAASGYAAPSRENDSRGIAQAHVHRTVEGVPGNLYPRREIALGDEE